MYIKVYKKCQLILLRNINPLLKKYCLPKEVLKTVEWILKEKEFGKKGFIALLINPLTDDSTEIKDILNCYPHKLKIVGDIKAIEVEESDTYMTEGREWYLDTWKVKEEKSFIYIIYSMTQETLYGETIKD